MRSVCYCFKGKIKGKNYAIRCFQQATLDSLNNIKPYLIIFKNLDWLYKFELITNEINVNNKKYPVLQWLGKWYESSRFYFKNINNKQKLSDLQTEFVNLSKELEKNNIGHQISRCKYFSKRI